MATSKLTDRTELTVQPADDDLVHVVDVDDTTGSADGTSKKITVQNLLLGAGGSSTTITVRNNSGGTITKGKAVYITGVVSGTPTISLASNLSSSTTPAVGLVAEDIANNADGNLLAFGELTNIDTSGFTPSATLYLGTLGNLTTTKPTGTALIQNIGTCLKVSASTGSILVEGAGRTNDVPNIPDGQAWVGNSSGVATPTTLGAVATGNNFTDLSDTPSTLTANYAVQVNSGGTALGLVPAVRQLNDLQDVTLGTISNGDVITYDSGTSQWRSQAPSGGGGGSDSFAKFATQFNTATTAGHWRLWSLYNNSSMTSAQWYTQMPLPAAGSFTDIVVSVQANESCTFGLFKNVSLFSTITTASPTYTQSLTTSGANTIHTFTMPTNSFAAGDRVAFAIQTSTVNRLNYVNVVARYEFS